MMSTSTCMTSQTAGLAGIRRFCLANAFEPAAQSRSAERHRPFQCSGPVSYRDCGAMARWRSGVLVRWSHPDRVSGARDLCLFGLACHSDIITVHFDVRGAHLMVSRWTKGRRRGPCTALQGCMRPLPGSWARLSGHEKRLGPSWSPQPAHSVAVATYMKFLLGVVAFCLQFPALRQSLSVLDVGHSFDWFLCELFLITACDWVSVVCATGGFRPPPLSRTPMTLPSTTAILSLRRCWSFCATCNLALAAHQYTRCSRSLRFS